MNKYQSAFWDYIDRVEKQIELCNGYDIDDLGQSVYEHVKCGCDYEV